MTLSAELSAEWKRALRSPGPMVLLVTVVFDEDALWAEPHPAGASRVLRAATSTVSVPDVSSGRVLPFPGTVVGWPALAREITPEERRAPVATTQLSLTADAAFPREAVGPNSPPSVWARIDLYRPGMTLADARPWMAGPVTAASEEDRRGGVRITIEDGDTLRSVPFPAGNLTVDSADFPDAPDMVLGQARRQVIFGPFPYPIPCIPISKDGRRWYLCEPAVEAVPTSVQIGGVDVDEKDRPVVSVGHLATDPSQTFTELVFPASVSSLGLYGNVTASGGVGLPVDSAPVTLLRDVGGYRLSPRAERDLLRVAQDFNFSVFQNKQAPVLDLVRDRILPQTDLMLTLHLGRVETYRLGDDGGRRVRLALGEGLVAFVPQTREQGTSETAYNAIEVKFRRNILLLSPTGTLMRDAIVVDANYGGPIGAMLARSQDRYGRRPLTIEAPDIVDEASGGVPASVVALGELTAVLAAFPPRPLTYDATWDVGEALDLNARVELTDLAQGVNATPARLVRTELLATGPRLTFATEDEIP